MEITLKNLQKKIPIPRANILKAAESASRRLKIPSGVVSIVFVSARRMRTINKKYLDHDHLTDVLTFDLGQNIREIVICPQAASDNAKEHRTSARKEMILYAVHGLLHLAGYDDKTLRGMRRMRRMEKKLL